jgi:hypothetical protein
MNSPPVLPDRQQQAREIADLRRREREYRAALECDAAMFARLAESLVGFRTTAGMGATMRVRADRLNKLLKAAPAAQDVPANQGAAEPQLERTASGVRP